MMHPNLFAQSLVIDIQVISIFFFCLLLASTNNAVENVVSTDFCTDSIYFLRVVPKVEFQSIRYRHI